MFFEVDGLTTVFPVGGRNQPALRGVSFGVAASVNAGR